MTRARTTMSDVEVWIVRLSALGLDDLRRYGQWLTDGERLQGERFATELLQREYVVTRALSRWVLSRYVQGVRPSDWRFERTSAGRPFVAGPPRGGGGDLAPPQFNLSNAGGLVVCAVSPLRVGVDVEPMTRGQELLEGSPRVFSELERADLQRLPPDRRAARAVALWTLKEAYLKARGDGIAVHPGRISMREAAPQSFQLHDVAALGDDPTAWRVYATEVQPSATTDPCSRCMLAVAVERAEPREGERASLDVLLREVVP